MLASTQPRYKKSLDQHTEALSSGIMRNAWATAGKVQSSSGRLDFVGIQFDSLVELLEVASVGLGIVQVTAGAAWRQPGHNRCGKPREGPRPRSD